MPAGSKAKKRATTLADLVGKRAEKTGHKMTSKASEGSAVDDPKQIPAKVKDVMVSPKRKNTKVILEDGVEYRLVSASDTHVTVGTGSLFLGSGLFHGKEIPSGFSVVNVNSVVDESILLPYPNKNDDPPQTELGQAIGSRVLWPTKCVRPKQSKRKR